MSETVVDNPYVNRKLAGNKALMTFRSEYVKEAAFIARHGAVPSIELFHCGDTTSPEFLEGRNPHGPNRYVRPGGVQAAALPAAKPVCPTRRRAGR